MAWSFDFDSPQYLWLLLLMPAFWLIGRKSLHALGAGRRRAALLLRTLVAGLLVLALAEPNWLKLAHRLSVLFVVDSSASIQPAELSDALAYVNKAVSLQRVPSRGDRAGLVVFGRDAATEVPPIDAPWRVANLESAIDPRFSNIENALSLAEASFPPDSAKRVVLLSDGNQNQGDVSAQVDRMLAAGTGIDVVPIRYQRQGDVVLERLDVPANLRSGAPFNLRIVVDNLSDGRVATGKLRVIRELGGTKQDVSTEAVVLQPGKQVLTLRQKIDEVGLTTYEANFVPDDVAVDAQSQNNSATAFCQIAGKGRVLLIEDAAGTDQFSRLVNVLRQNEIDVTVRDTRRPFDGLADLQQFDEVVLADVPRVAGDGEDEITQFSDEQIRQLVQNTQHFGCGLVVLGGPNSLGAGGWTNTELEKALPVDFQVDNSKVEAVGALVLVIDSSGSMAGEKIAWAKAAAVAASEMLGRRDFIGVLAFDSEFRWVIPLQRNGTASRTRSRIQQLGPGGGTDMMPGLQEGYRAIQGVPASIKHVITLTDGQTPPAAFNQLANKMRQAGITTSGVAVGPDADRMVLSGLAKAGGGKFYYLRNPKAIPRIFMREARRVSMPLVFEDKAGYPVHVEAAENELAGISSLPPITGNVLTTIKENPLVEVLATTPRQPPSNSAILAAWTYGLGRVVVLTTDIGQRWATAWTKSASYDKLLLQLVRRSLRGRDANEQLTLSTELRDGKIGVVVTALDKDGQHLNYLAPSMAVVRPDGSLAEQPLEQAAPGRYTATVDGGEPGNYFLSVSADATAAPMRAAVEVLQTAEFERLASNESFLAELASRTPVGGTAGQVITSLKGVADTEALLRANVFRPGVAPAISRSRVWPLALLAASLIFLGDVFCRRVMLRSALLSTAIARLLARRSRTSNVPTVAPLERLKRTKASVAADLQSRTAPRGTTSPMTPAPKIVDLKGAAGDGAAAPMDDRPAGEPPAPADYTSRLLAAKQRAREQRNRGQ